MADERVPPGFTPCLWCARPLEAARSSAEFSAGHVPLYCSDGCRDDLERSLVKRIYDASECAAEESGYRDFAQFDAITLEIFKSRLRAALSPAPNFTVVTKIAV